MADLEVYRMKAEEMPLVQSEDDASTIRFEPMRLDPKDTDLIHYIDVFELIKDLVRRSMADKRKEKQ